MDELAASFPTLETKKRPKYLMTKSLPGPIKTKVESSPTKQAGRVFINIKGSVQRKLRWV
jgi:hypothetical protein